MADGIFYDHDLLWILQCRIARDGLRATARDLEFSAPFVSDVAKGKRGLSVEMAKRLGFTLQEEPEKPPRVWRFIK